MASSAAMMLQQHQQQHGGDGASSHGPPSPTSGGIFHVQPILGGQQGGQMNQHDHGLGLMSPTGDGPERGEWPMAMGPPTPSRTSGEWVPLLSAQNAFGANNGSFSALQLGTEGSNGMPQHGGSALTLQQQLQQLSLSAPSNIIAGHHGAHLNDNSPVSSLSSDSNAVFLSGNLAALGNAAASHFNGSQYTGTLGGPASLGGAGNSYSGTTAGTGSGNATSHNSYNSNSNGNNVQTLYSTNEQMALARLAAQAATAPSAAASHTAALSAAQQGALLGSLASLGSASARGNIDYAAAFGAPQQLSSSLYIKNLPPDTDKLFLYERFSPYGAILSVKVLNDPVTGTCRGVGFVNYSEHASAVRAIQALHGTKIADKLLHVSLQTPRIRA